MPLSRITVTVPEDVLRAADERARDLDRSRSWVVAEALRRFVSGSSLVDRVGTSLAVREPVASHGKEPAYRGRLRPGLGAYRQVQLEADLRLTAEQRVLESERAGRVAELGAPGHGIARVVTFDRFEDFLEWKRWEDLPR